MGFYGTTSSSAKTNLQIDRTYPNKLTAKNNASTDGVYAGRYVLVEYDATASVFHVDNPLFRYEINGQNVFSYTLDTSNNIPDEPFTKFEPNVIYYVVDVNTKEDWLKEPAKYNYEIWMLNEKSGQFVEATEENGIYTDYTTNYNVDKIAYNAGRGWDSTLWQKVYVDGQADYVLVAELNSVIPSFDITVDAPSILPQPPHFDDSHTNVYYDIHLQPQWGVRVAAAENEAYSDEVGPYITKTYNQNNELLNEKTENKSLNIFYNKAGFKPDIVSKINDKVDEIKFTPSGKSGLYYNDHGTDPMLSTVSKKNDIYELSMMLPSFGNSISEMWDVVYGPGDKDKKRNLDIAWNSTRGLRLVKTGDDGYTYYPNEVNTLAGCINSVHDLMGMIIVDDKTSIAEANEDIDLYDENKIYYFSNDKVFSRKAPLYIWKEVPYIYEQIGLTADTYKPNFYYEKSGENYIISSGDYSSSTVYYSKQVTENTSGYQEIGLLTDYIRNKYFNLVNKDYIIAEDAYQSSLTYFDVTPSSIDVKPEYYINTYYYFDNNNLLLDDNPIATEGREYYNFKGLLDGPSLRYIPNLYYYENEDEEYILDKNENLTIGRQYYVKENPEDPNSGLDPVSIEAAGDINYYKEGNNIIAVAREDIKNTQQYYLTLEAEGPLTLYEANKYYYKDNKNYKLDTANSRTSGRIYYTLDIRIASPFYQEGVYYYYDNNEYILDNLTSATEGRVYYLKDFYYVIKDDENLFNKGAIWNPNVKTIPATISLGTRELPMYQMVELKEFAQSFNTIHGLILKINSMLEADDTQIRDTETVQGCINTVKDIIDKFDELIPGSINIVDYLGRVSCAELIGDTWIGTKVDDVNKDITINHLEANEAIQYHQTITDISPNFNESFDIPYIGFDAKGHASDFGSVKTITLPKMTLLSDGAENGNVVTKITLNDNYDTLTQTLIDVGNLTLQTYNHSVSSESVASDLVITTNDTLNSALSKLQDQAIINAEDITGLEGRTDALENEFTETGRIGILESKVATNISTIDSHNTRISVLEEKVGDNSVADSISSALNNISVSNNGTTLNGLQAILDDYLARIIALENIPVQD